MDNFIKLDETKHMLEWLDDNPYATMRLQMEESLNKQVSGCKLEIFNVSSKPQWFTGVKPDEEDKTKSILIKVGVSFDIELFVCEQSSYPTKLEGIYSWVGVNLDKPIPKQQIWFDINKSVDESDCKSVLMNRIYSLKNN